MQDSKQSKKHTSILILIAECVKFWKRQRERVAANGFKAHSKAAFEKYLKIPKKKIPNYI